MMDPLIANYFERFKTLHKDCTEQFSALKKEALDWSPGEEMNSIAVLVAHIAGSEKFWIGDIVMQEPSGRDRPEEFATKTVNVEQLQMQLDDSLALIENALNRLSPEDLQDTRIRSGGQGEVSVGWAILHSLQHTAMHVGHLQITKQLLESSSDQ